MIIISDTSTLSCFARIGRLDLLQQLYGEIHVPEAVLVELRRAQHYFGDHWTSLPWLRIHDVSGSPLLPLLLAELDPGEAHAIALALRLIEQGEQCQVLLDEQSGRRLAARWRLNISGSVGLLIAAKRRNLIAAVRPLLDDLRRRGGLWVSEALYDSVLVCAGER
jgi:hypothetical protein